MTQYTGGRQNYADRPDVVTNAGPLYGKLLPHTPCASIRRTVVAGIQIIDADAAAAAAGGMDEPTVADVHPDMGDARRDCMKENQIARLQAVPIDVPSHLELPASGVGQRDPFAAIEVAGEPGTVESAASLAAVHIGGAAIGIGRPHQIHLSSGGFASDDAMMTV